MEVDTSVEGIVALLRASYVPGVEVGVRPPASLFARVVVPPEARPAILDAARRIDERSDRASNTRRWIAGFNLVGVIGEYIYARVAGWPFEPADKADLYERTGKLSDGGEDFPGVDVKGTTLPSLKVAAGDELKAATYAHVFVDVAGWWGYYGGYATAAALEAAPRRDFGNGPTRVLEETDLVRALPERAEV